MQKFFVGVSYMARYFEPGHVVRIGDRGQVYELVKIYGPGTPYYGQWSVRESISHKWSRLSGHEVVTLVGFNLEDYENGRQFISR